MIKPKTKKIKKIKKVNLIVINVLRLWFKICGPWTKSDLWKYMVQVCGSVLKIIINIACI